MRPPHNREDGYKNPCLDMYLCVRREEINPKGILEPKLKLIIFMGDVQNIRIVKKWSGR
jgi:hypothetical protein